MLFIVVDLGILYWTYSLPEFSPAVCSYDDLFLNYVSVTIEMVSLLLHLNDR